MITKEIMDMNMVILKGSTMRNFYKNSGNFFSRRRTKTRVSSFERKMFVVLEKNKFIIFWSFLTSVMKLEVDNFIFFEISKTTKNDGIVFQKKIEKWKFSIFLKLFCLCVFYDFECLSTIKYMFQRYFFRTQSLS